MLLLLQVDQLLEYHFEEDMTRLTQHCGKKLKEGRQTIIVSATLKDQVISPLACTKSPCPVCSSLQHRLHKTAASSCLTCGVYEAPFILLSYIYLHHQRRNIAVAQMHIANLTCICLWHVKDKQVGTCMECME